MKGVVLYLKEKRVQFGLVFNVAFQAIFAYHHVAASRWCAFGLFPAWYFPFPHRTLLLTLS